MLLGSTSCSLIVALRRKSHEDCFRGKTIITPRISEPGFGFGPRRRQRHKSGYAVAQLWRRVRVSSGAG